MYTIVLVVVRLKRSTGGKSVFHRSVVWYVIPSDSLTVESIVPRPVSLATRSRPFTRPVQSLCPYCMYIGERHICSLITRCRLFKNHVHPHSTCLCKCRYVLSDRFDRPHSEKLKSKNRGYGGPASCASGGLPRSFLACRPAKVVSTLAFIYDTKDTEVAHIIPHLLEVFPLIVG